MAPAPAGGGSALALGAHLTLATLFVAFVAVSWVPRVTTLGGTDVGLSALLLAAMVPLMLVAPRVGGIDGRAAATRSILLVALAFVIAWGYIGVYRLDDPFRAGRLILSLGQGIVLILVMTEYLTPRTVRLAMAAAIVMLLFVCALSLYNYVGGQPNTITYLQRDRSSGLFKNPNQYGMVSAMIAPFAVAMLFQRSTRLLGALLFVTGYMSLLMAASKTNLMVALLFTLIALGYALVTSGRIRTLFVVLPILLFLIAVGGLPTLEFFNPRAAGIIRNSVIGGDLQSSTVYQRYELWRYSLDVMRSAPFFGEGTGQRIDTIGQEHSHSHNVFIDFGRTTGLPGMAGALVLLGSCCWIAIATLIRVAGLPADLAARLPGRALVVGACLAILSYTASNQMSDSLGPSTSVFLWLCIGIVLRRNALLFGDEEGRAEADFR